VTDLVDNFSGTGTLTAHTSDSGHSWTNAPNNFFGSEGGSVTVLSSGSLRFTQPSDEYSYFSGMSSYEGANGYVESILTLPSGVTPPGISSYAYYIGMRYNDNYDGIIAAMNLYPSPWTAYSVRITDGYSEIAYVASVAIANPITIRLEVSGTTALVKINGVTVCTGTTGPVVNGKAMLMGQQPTSGALMTIDSITSIQTPPANAFWNHFAQTVEVFQ
jgi:hypothetical protein